MNSWFTQQEIIEIANRRRKEVIITEEVVVRITAKTVKDASQAFADYLRNAFGEEAGIKKDTMEIKVIAAKPLVCEIKAQIVRADNKKLFIVLTEEWLKRKRTEET